MGFLDRIKANMAKPPRLNLGDRFRFETVSPTGRVNWLLRFEEEACYFDITHTGTTYSVAVYPHVEFDHPEAVVWRSSFEDFIRNANIDLHPVLRLTHEYALSTHEGGAPARDEAEAALKAACENLTVHRKA
jgi:hypothetical protein